MELVTVKGRDGARFLDDLEAPATAFGANFQGFWLESTELVSSLSP